MLNSLDKKRLSVAKRVRELRLGRRWTQTELSSRLGLSQARLSQIERGAGSFTAEQLLVILEIFNVSLADLVPQESSRRDSELQNTLARLGAAHLQERDDLLPSNRYRDLGPVVRDALASGSPRLVTALAPVLIGNLDKVSLNHLNAELAATGLERRLGWLVENVAHAIRDELDQAPPRVLARRYRRADVVLSTFLSWASPGVPRSDDRPAPEDVLDPTVRSPRTLANVRAAASPISRRWGIVTGLQPKDFLDALRAARVDH